MSNTQTVIIRVRSDGTRVVTREIKEMGGAADKTAQQFSKLKGLIAGVVTGVVVNQIKQLLDTYTTMQNKLRLTTTDQANLNAVFLDLQRISSDTRSSLETNANLYSRLALSTKDLGTSQKEVLQFTESLNKSVKLSGATAIEAENAIIQLTQGLASGTLRGDELRSVLEQLPAVADVIAKGLGVTRGELRKMGEQGKITGQAVLEAFKDAREEIDQKFKRTLPTISEGFQALKNQLLVTVGSIDAATGASSALGGALANVADFIKQATPELVNFTRALLGTLDPADKLSDAGKIIATVFVTVYGSLKAVGGLILGTILGAFKTVGRVIGGVVAAVMAVLRGEFSQAYEIVKEAGTDITNTWVDNTNAAGEGAVNATSEMFTKLDQIWNEGSRNIQDRSHEIIGAIDATAGKSKVRIGPSEEELAKQARAMEKLKNQLQGVLNEIAPLAGAQMEYETAIRTLTKANEEKLITDAQVTQYLEDLEERYIDILDPLGKYNAELSQQSKLLKLNAREREVEAQLLEATKSLLAQGVKLTKEETNALREKLQALQSLNEATAAQDDLLGNSVEKRRQFLTDAEAMRALLTDQNSGFGKGDAANKIMEILPPELLENTTTQSEAQIAQIQYMYDQIKILRDKNLIDEQTANAARMKLAAQSFDVQTKNAQNFFSGLSGLMASENKKLFKIGQAAAIANASIKGGEAIMNALATPPWYVGAALAIGAAAQVYQQIAQIKATKPPTGYMAGGYTGSGPTNQAAGIVHGQEFVMNAAATRRIGVGNLEALQSGATRVATRGSKNSIGGTTMKVSIENYGTSKDFQVNQISRDEIRIIARDEAEAQVARQAPNVIASEISRPNSKVSKALSSNTNTERRR